nr:hypothetical protein [Tanacetum cinerariifolium]
MRTKPGVDTLNFNVVYNNIRVFDYDVKGSTGSSSSTHNVAFVSSDNTSNTNEVNTAYGVSTSSCHNSQKEGSSSYTNDLMYSLFANQSSGPQLDHKDLEQFDEFDLKEMDLKWQVAMISTRLMKFYKKGRKLHFDAKEPVGFDKSKVKCFNCHNTGHFAKECRSKGNQDSKRRDARNTRYKEIDNGKRSAKQDEHKAMVIIDGEGSDTKVTSCSKSSDVEDSYVNDRFVKVIGIHAVPPPMTGNYMPLKSNFRIDESKFSYGLKQPTTSESDAKTNDLDSCDSNSDVETLETTSTHTARKVNTARLIVDEIRPRNNVYKSHSPIRRPFNRTTTPKENFTQHKVNTVTDKPVSAVGNKWETAVKASVGCN